jgi:hypothetical protein
LPVKAYDKLDQAIAQMEKLDKEGAKLHATMAEMTLTGAGQCHLQRHRC